jgi:hypothetical protein
MAEPAEAPVPAAESAEAKPAGPMSFDQSVEAALKTFEENGPGGAEEEAASAPEEGKAGEAPGVTPADEPEHVKWAKSVSGNVDEKGTLNQDRVLKQAYELHKQSQATAQQLAQLNSVLRHPEIAATLQRLASGQTPEAAKKEPEGEKTDEQVLSEYVKDLIKRETAGLQEQTRLAYNRAIEAESNLAYNRLCQEFGKEDYDGIRQDIASQLAVVAQQANTTLPSLIEYLVQKGMLYDTFASAARNILYPRMKERTAAAATQASQKKVEDKKKLALTPKGTSPVSVAKSPKKINSFEDAAKAAEEELDEKGKKASAQ